MSAVRFGLFAGGLCAAFIIMKETTGFENALIGQLSLITTIQLARMQ